jgi:hypothetical protein
METDSTVSVRSPDLAGVKKQHPVIETITKNHICNSKKPHNHCHLSQPRLERWGRPDNLDLQVVETSMNIALTKKFKMEEKSVS